MHPMLNIAVRAGRNAGNIIARNLGQQGQFSVEEKAKNDFVTSIDKECESIIVDTLLKSYPDHNILAEERGSVSKAQSDYQWIIDPLDGTQNFVQGIPHVAVSIALKHQNKTVLGVVFNPFTNEMFTASRGDGASLNGIRIRVGDKKALDAAVIGTAWPVRFRERMPAYMNLFHKLIDNCADARRMGVASLDMAYVACGRFDGFLEQGLKPWDYAAGEIIIREAGGIVTDFMGEVNYTKTGNVVCGNPYITKALLTKVCDPQNLPDILR